MYRKVLFCLLLLICLVSSASALEISPNSFDVSVKQNQYQEAHLLVNNTLNHTINVSLQTDLSISFFPSSFSLTQNAMQNITLYFFGQSSKTGNIVLAYDNQTMNISVTITVKQENKNVTVFPVDPQSGKLFALSLPSDDDTNGFIWVDEQLIPLTFVDGFAVVQTDQTVYGDAQLWLNGKGFVYTFNIRCGLEGNMFFNIPNGIKIGDVADIALMIGDKVLSKVSVTLTDPQKHDYDFTTDDNGKIHPIMDKAGTWSVKSDFNDKHAISRFAVAYRPLTITTDKEVYTVGDTAIISFDESNVDVSIKNGNAIVYQSSITTGAFEFSPTSAGTYRLSASTDEKQGTKSFTVRMPTDIRILDENNMQTSILKVDKNYIIQVIDKDGNPVPYYDNIMSSQGTVIYLDNGIGSWTPTASGSMTLSVGNSDEYIGSTLMISIEGTADYGFLIWIAVIIAIIVVIYLLYRKNIIHLPKMPKHKRIPDKIL